MRNSINAEPGYYEDGEFGCRIENLVLIKQTDTKVCIKKAIISFFTHVYYYYNNKALILV